MTNRFDGTISRIDPNGASDVRTIPVGLDPRGIAVGFGSVWVGLAGSNTVVRVNPQTGSVTSIIVGNGPGSLTVSTDAVWVVNTLGDTVSRINPDTNLVVDTIEVGKGPSGIAIAQGTVWVANEADGTLSRIDPIRHPSARRWSGVSRRDSLAWATTCGSRSAERRRRIAEARCEWFRPMGPFRSTPLSPTTSSRSVCRTCWGTVCVAFEPIGGTNASLVPDLATSMPTPTDGGRTYTFALRPGIRYSNGDVVAADDFLRGFERGFHLNRDVYRYLYGGLVGAIPAGRGPATCDLSRGIVSDDVSGTITFHLEAADPDFLNKLTMAFAYPFRPPSRDEEQARMASPAPARTCRRRR